MKRIIPGNFTALDAFQYIYIYIYMHVLLMLCACALHRTCMWYLMYWNVVDAKLLFILVHACSRYTPLPNMRTHIHTHTAALHLGSSLFLMRSTTTSSSSRITCKHAAIWSKLSNTIDCLHAHVNIYVYIYARVLPYIYIYTYVNISLCM